MDERIAQLDGKLCGILPPLQEILSLKVDDEEYSDLDRQKKKERTFEAIRDLLIRESEKRTLVITIEDLHWIDRISQELLTYLIDWLANAHILLILLYRPEYTHPWTSKSYYNQLRVDQLSTGTSAELVQSILEEGEVAPELRELILTRTAGNPLFMEEFTHALIENGCIQRKNHEYILTTKSSDICVPDTIQGIIAARMDRLEDNLKRTMQVASVIGRDFAYRILQTITGMQEELKSYLLNLQGLEFIYEKSLFPELEYVFKHALTQEVAYSSLLHKRRKEIHERIGNAIEQLYPDRLEEFYESLAFHFKQGESLDKAVDYFIKSGEKSSDRYAVEEAHRHFQEAFDILSGKPERTKEEDTLLIDLQIKWAYIFYHRGDFRGLTDLLTAHVDLAESLGDKARLGMFYGWLGFAIASRARVRESYQYLRKALKLGEETGDQRLIGYACTWLAWSCIYLGLLDEAITHGERAQEISRALKTDHYLYFKSMAGIGEAYSFRGDRRKVMAAGEAILEYGQMHNSVRSLVMGHWTVALAYSMDDDLPSEIECAQRALEVAADPFYALLAKIQLGTAYVFSGRIQEAEQLLQECLSFSRDFGLELIDPLLEACLAAVTLFSGGQPGEAMERGENALRTLLESERKPYAVLVASGIGMMYGSLVGQIPEADQKAQEHLNIAIELGAEIGTKGTMGQAYLDLGLLHRTKGEKERARECIGTAVSLFEECELENRLRQAKEALESL